VNAQKANDTIEKVRQLQRKLYLAAKSGSKRKFHALYDKIYREDILTEAWKRVKANGGVGGIDGISIRDIETYGADKLVSEIRQELIAVQYYPQPVKRVNIPKADGSKRALGIPTVKDRIVQMATKIVIEPVFEAKFKDNSYGFRPKRNAHQALEEVRKACDKGGGWVVDADIQNFFDTINHEKLMKLVEVRINDRRVLKLIRQWLKAGVLTEGKYSDSEIGSPQGGVISPLLANIYLHYLDMLWEKQGTHFGKLVRYADDLVVICKTRTAAKQALELLETIMERLELVLHPEKTKIVTPRKGGEGFDFLGMHHRGMEARTRSGRGYSCTHQVPCKKAMMKMRESVRTLLTNPVMLGMDMRSIIDKLNPKIRGWKNYYGLKTARKWLYKISQYILRSLTRWWNKKRQHRKYLAGINVVYQLVIKLGLVNIAAQ